MKQLVNGVRSEQSPCLAHPFWKLGGKYFIRTVTHHLTGELTLWTETELILRNAAWIADDGRFADALAKCEFNEVEPFPAPGIILIGRGSIIDAVPIATIPTSQK